MKKVFVSYSHKQAPWVWERLVPILKAAGCGEVFVDKERFTAGHGVVGQMDAYQDQADVSLLVLSNDYLASDACRHEMERAIAADPTFSDGKVLPVKRIDCDMSRFQGATGPPLWVDLTEDSNADPWNLLLRSLEADKLGTVASHWLEVRDEIVRALNNQQSVSLVISGKPNWRALIDHLKQDYLPELAIVNLDDPATITRDGLVRTILSKFAGPPHVSMPPRDLEALNALLSRAKPAQLALLHFECVLDPERSYGANLFHTLRYLLDSRKLTLLVESRIAFRDLLPRDHPLSVLDPISVPLRGIRA